MGWAVGDFTGKQLGGGAGTGAAGLGSSSSPVSLEPTSWVCPAGAGELCHGAAALCCRTGGKRSLGASFHVSPVSIPCVFLRHQSLQQPAACTNKPGRDPGDVCLISPGAWSPALQPWAVTETRNMPNFMSQGPTHSWRWANAHTCAASAPSTPSHPHCRTGPGLTPGGT